jgi:hypothetical protein
MPMHAEFSTTKATHQTSHTLSQLPFAGTNNVALLIAAKELEASSIKLLSM